MKNKIKKLTEKYRADCFLFTSRNETFYLSGAEFDGFWMLVIKEEIYILCSKMIESQAKEFFRGSQAHIYIGVPLSKSVTDILISKNADSVIMDTKYMTASDFILISERLHSADIETVSKFGIMDDMRAVKDEEEAEKLKEACRIVSKVCDTVKSELKPGLSEIDIHYRILELFAQNRVKESFTPIVAAGKNSANPHHSSSNYKFAENDTVMIDLGCVYKGYCSDLTRTYYLGKISDKFRKIWDIVKDSQSAVLKGVRSGLPLSWADKTARDIIEAAGYKDKFIHTTGHGVGIEIHEKPSLAINAEGVFLTHMAVTVEPGIYLEGEFGIRIEDTILITEKGCEILTSAAY